MKQTLKPIEFYFGKTVVRQWIDNIKPFTPSIQDKIDIIFIPLEISLPTQEYIDCFEKQMQEHYEYINRALTLIP